MNYKLMFELAKSVIGQQRKGDYRDEAFDIAGKKVKLNFAQQQDLLTRTIQCFMHAPVVGDENARIQAFGTSGDLPKLTKDVFSVNSYTEDQDLLWQSAYRTMQLGEGQLEWEIASVETGIVFKLIPEGGKVEYGDIAGEKVTASVEKYGAGLAVTWEVINGRKLTRFIQMMEDARTALYRLWANIHYGLLATAGTSNQITWQTATDTIDRDIKTLNKGANDCAKANKDKGYGNMANASFQLYISPDLEDRIEQALRVTSQNAILVEGRSGEYVRRRIIPNYTYNENIPANKGLLVLPGNKIQNAVYLAEDGFSREEIESLNQLRTYWTAFGAIVADTDQVYELAFA